MRSPELPATSALAVFFLLLLLPTHIRMRNVAILVGMVSIMLTDAVYFVNTIVWAGNVHNVAPVWCDIGQSPFSSVKPAVC